MKINQDELIKMGEKPKKISLYKRIKDFFIKHPNKFYSSSSIGLEIYGKKIASGSISGNLSNLVDDGFLKSVKCPCGKGVLYYYGKTPKIV